MNLMLVSGSDIFAGTRTLELKHRRPVDGPLAAGEHGDGRQGDLACVNRIRRDQAVELLLDARDGGDVRRPITTPLLPRRDRQTSSHHSRGSTRCSQLSSRAVAPKPAWASSIANASGEL